LPSRNNENTFLYDRLEEFGWGTKFLLELYLCKGTFWGEGGGALAGVRQGDLDAEEMGEVEHFSWVKKR
jgi:hypothetical protein